MYRLGWTGRDDDRGVKIGSLFLSIDWVELAELMTGGVKMGSRYLSVDWVEMAEVMTGQLKQVRFI